MRKHLLFIVWCLAFAAPVYGQEQSPEAYCLNLGTWVNSVTTKMVSGVPKESVIEVIRQEEGNNLPPELPGIIEAIYSPEMPKITLSEEIFAIVSLFTEQCIVEVKSRQQND